MIECPCLIVNEFGNCIDCGKKIDNPEYTITGLKAPLSGEMYLPDLGNILAIAQLAKKTIDEYDELAKSNEDPQVPSRPRLRMIGGQFYRIPFRRIWNEIVAPSFFHAKRLGFRGNYSKWCEHVKESRNIPNSPDSPVTK